MVRCYPFFKILVSHASLCVRLPFLMQSDLCFSCSFDAPGGSKTLLGVSFYLGDFIELGFFLDVSLFLHLFLHVSKVLDAICYYFFLYGI